MTQRRTLGDILQGFGRITEEDVNRALEHQRSRGGYFGEALQSLGILSQEEIEWGLASQFDLPYIFPDPDSVDPEAAALVTPEWALANLALPIMRTDRSVTVVIDSPIRTAPVEELRSRTGLEIEIALASGDNIRQVIRQVYARSAPADEAPGTRALLPLTELLSRSLQVGSSRFGISIRGPRALGWYDDRGTIRRRLLTSSWSTDLEGMLDPPPSAAIEGRPQASWRGRMNREGAAGPVEVRYLSGPGGSEYLFIMGNEQPRTPFSPPGPELVSEVQLLVRSGSARFVVSTEPPELVEELLPHLPGLLLPPFRRTAHLTEETEGEGEATGVFGIGLSSDPDVRRETLVELRAFRFDAVTADLAGLDEERTNEVLDLAGTVFLPHHAASDTDTLRDAGVRWELHATRSDANDTLEWRLQPLAS